MSKNGGKKVQKHIHKKCDNRNVIILTKFPWGFFYFKKTQKQKGCFSSFLICFWMPTLSEGAKKNRNAKFELFWGWPSRDTHVLMEMKDQNSLCRKLGFWWAQTVSWFCSPIGSPNPLHSPPSNPERSEKHFLLDWKDEKDEKDFLREEILREEILRVRLVY